LASWSRRPGRRGRRRSRPSALTAPGHGQEAVPKPGRPSGQSSVLRRGAASAVDTVGCAGGALPTQQGSPLTRTSLWVRSARRVWKPVSPAGRALDASETADTAGVGTRCALRRQPSAREDKPGSPTTRTLRAPWSPH
jgi:hypothetical protein